MRRTLVTYAPINFADKLARFSDHWSPKISRR